MKLLRATRQFINSQRNSTPPQSHSCSCLFATSLADDDNKTQTPTVLRTRPTRRRQMGENLSNNTAVTATGKVTALSHAKNWRPVAPCHSSVHVHGYHLISPNKTNISIARVFVINRLFTAHLRKEIKTPRGGEHCLL